MWNLAVRHLLSRQGIALLILFLTLLLECFIIYSVNSVAGLWLSQWFSARAQFVFCRVFSDI